MKTLKQFGLVIACFMELAIFAVYVFFFLNEFLFKLFLVNLFFKVLLDYPF